MLGLIQCLIRGRKLLNSIEFDYSDRTVLGLDAKHVSFGRFPQPLVTELHETGPYGKVNKIFSKDYFNGKRKSLSKSKAYRRLWAKTDMRLKYRTTYERSISKVKPLRRRKTSPLEDRKEIVISPSKFRGSCILVG